jgi:hypothetical protein
MTHDEYYQRKRDLELKIWLLMRVGDMRFELPHLAAQLNGLEQAFQKRDLEGREYKHAHAH